MIVQQILHLWLDAASLDRRCVSWAFHDPTDGSGARLPAVEPPYASGVDALRDGWMLLSAPPTRHPDVLSGVGREHPGEEFVFERRVRVWSGATTADPMVVGPSVLHGRGVFATRPISAGELVHVAPVLVLSDEDFDQVAGTPFEGHLYEWAEGGAAFALGFGSVFNHATPSNLRYERTDDAHPSAPAHAYIARRDVAEGEELTIDYVDGDEAELWFDPAGADLSDE